MKKKIIINGRFLTQNITGVQRVAYELVRELDKNIDKNIEVELVHPENKIQEIELTNIKVKKIGMLKGHLWEQVSLALYALKEKATILNLCLTNPILNPGIVMIHDISFKVNPHFFNWKFNMWYDFLTKNAVKRAKKILTVSEFSKQEMIKYYKASSENIEVVYNGWQHMERVEEDSKILNKLNVKEKEYFLAVSSMNPNKNFKLIIECAEKNPDVQFVIAGKFHNKVFSDTGVDFDNLKNIKYAGYVTDEELKSLYKNAKAFIFPSFYEGFGIPPLEAIACGAKAIVSNTSCLPEIFDNNVVYIDPTDVASLCKVIEDLNEIESNAILEKYSWEKSSKKIVEII